MSLLYAWIPAPQRRGRPKISMRCFSLEFRTRGLVVVASRVTLEIGVQARGEEEDLSLGMVQTWHGCTILWSLERRRSRQGEWMVLGWRCVACVFLRELFAAHFHLVHLPARTSRRAVSSRNGVRTCIPRKAQTPKRQSRCSCQLGKFCQPPMSIGCYR